MCSHVPLYDRSPSCQLLIALLIVLGTGLLLFSALILAGTFIFGTDLGLMKNASSAVGENETAFLKYILISQDISVFIVPAIIILTILKPDNQTSIFDVKTPGINEVFLVVLLMICIFPITSCAGEINSGLTLPAWLSGVEKWMVEKEDNATHLLKVIIKTDSLGGLILNVLILSALPALGEELIFRGVLQKILCKLFRSGHLAVWMTAIIFSAIHLQFFGFLPRFILGLVFGYLFLWSRNLLLPVLAHFVNNAVPTIGEYIQGMKEMNPPSDISLWKQMLILSFSLLVTLIILFYFRNKSRRELQR